MSSSNRRPPSSKPAAGGRHKRPSALEAGFERWLNSQLHKMYDPVLDERIPDELSRLIEAFDERPPKKEPSGE
ncbi:NepR family anti-sigma factor [Geminicoccaceae bacterium 1502E]|nr:NepR family anti-sigma factor [Geminicoccaceae bacterium 1502E]